MFRWLNLLLLLFCLIYHTGDGSTGTSVTVKGEKGGNITLTCEFKASEIDEIHLNRQSENIPVCPETNCSCRICNKGPCDIVIKHLVFSDAGKYILKIYYHNEQTMLKQQRTFNLHIHDDITAKKGKSLKLDVLLSNTDKVEKNSSGGWKEIWNRSGGVQDDHLTDSDGNLTIKGFIDSDVGTYKALDSDGNVLITVTVTEFSTESSDTLNSTNTNKTGDNEQHTVHKWIVPVVVCLVTVVVIVIAVIIRRCRRRDYMPGQVQEDPDL